jgi:phage tail-like protein
MSKDALNARGALQADPIRNYRFIVSFYPNIIKRTSGKWGQPTWKPIGRFGFASVSGFAFNVGVQSLREGGFNATVRQIPTHVEFSALQLDRGIGLGSQQNWDWMRMMLRTVQGRAQGPKALFRSDVEVAVLTAPVPYANRKKTYGAEDLNEYQAAKDDHVALRFRLYNAWPTSVVYSDLNAGDNALMVERMTLVHEGLDVSFGDQSGGKLIDAGDFGTPS